jgi:ribosomal protein L37AE/L43A
MKVRFPCPHCGATISTPVTAGGVWSCGQCRRTGPAPDRIDPLNYCAACRNPELYRKKDFPQWLGMGLLAVACGLFYIFAINYRYAVAWGILLGSAAIDGLIYYLVGDVVVCYRCGAEHRGSASRAFDPHSLATAEKYRQERIRLEKLRSATPGG